MRVLRGIASPDVAGYPLPVHMAAKWNRLFRTESGRPSRRAASRATSQVATGATASTFLLVLTVVARTRALDCPVDCAIPETQVRHTSFGSAKFVSKAIRTVVMSSPHIRAPSCAYAVHPRCWRREV